MLNFYCEVYSESIAGQEGKGNLSYVGIKYAARTCMLLS